MKRDAVSDQRASGRLQEGNWLCGYSMGSRANLETHQDVQLV